VFEIYYGPSQTFGKAGQPQPQVNILGKVSDPDGFDTVLVPDTLTFTLNGGTDVFPLSLGPDTRRLYDAGEFNVELWYSDLEAGPNTVVIKAKDKQANVTETTVTVNVMSGPASIPYTVNWASSAQISDVAQVVDGKWSTPGASGVRTLQIGYDRLIAVGDMSWENYEVTVPVTVHSVVPNGFVGPSYGPAVGVILGWNGHTDNPVCCTQPSEGYYPYGAIAAYRWEDPGSGEIDALKLYVKDDPVEDASGFTISTGVTYNFKVRVETVPEAGAFYRFKAWQSGAAEPAAWNVSTMGAPDDPPSGSLLLQAHHVDATFGNVVVTQISDAVDPVISDIQVIPYSTSAVITWKTDEPSDSSVKYGLTASYGTVVDDLTVLTDHTVTLTGLKSNTLYHFAVESEDQFGNVSTSTDWTFTTLAPGGTPGVDSDDFNTCTLNSIWTYTNPVADSPQTLTNTFTQNAQLSIAIPAGTDHDLHNSNEGGNRAPRIMQEAANTNFELEAKFDSPITTEYQMQGILVEQDVNQNYLRFEFYSDGTNVHVTVYKYVAGAYEFAGDDVLIPQAEGAPAYMRVKRDEAQWIFSYSRDGQTWTQTHSFVHPLAVTAVGAYGANASGASSPAHTTLLDYFFNTAAPIANEDGDRNSLTIKKVGSGDVVLDLSKTAYNCNDKVTLDANPGPGYKFGGWSGDIAGIANPAMEVGSINMTASRVITATFTAEDYLLTVLPVLNGKVTIKPEDVKEKYHYGDLVTLTATPDPGWGFGGWTVDGDWKSSSLTYAVEIKGNTTVAAAFTENFYNLTVKTVGQGSVALDPAPDPDAEGFAEGTEVELTATSALGWEFAGWGGVEEGDSLKNPLVVKITAPATVTATFTELPRRKLFIPFVMASH
jgi:hypothetical protein